MRTFYHSSRKKAIKYSLRLHRIFQMLCTLDYPLFLFRQEKGQKKPSKGALRANAPPLHTPAASPAVPTRTAVLASLPAANRWTMPMCRHVVRTPRGNLSAPRVGYIGAGVFDARERGSNAAPMTTSLVTFLFGNKKVTYMKSKKVRPVWGGLSDYRTKLMDRVVDQLSPGARMAAAGFSSHLRLPPSGEGRLCQGSMHTN